MRRWVPLLVLPVLAAGCYPFVSLDVSPDGRSLLFCNLRNPQALYRISIDGKEVRRVQADAVAARFSPDGKRCAFGWLPEGEDDNEPKESRLAVHDFESGKTKVLRSWPAKANEKGNESAPYPLSRWRPDGKSLSCVLWEASKDRSSTRLVVIDAESGAATPVAEGVGLNCAWSPDGRRLAFFRKEGQGPDLKEPVIGSLQIWEEGQPAKAVVGLVLEPTAEVTWLSNDRVLYTARQATVPIAYGGLTESRRAVHVYDLATNTTAPVVGAEGMEPHWLRLSPDRRRLLLLAKGPQTVETIERDGVSETVAHEIPTLWCYDFAEGTKGILVQSRDLEEDIPAVWVSKGRIAYSESDGKRIIMADVGPKFAISNRKVLDLEALLKPFKEEDEVLVKPEDWEKARKYLATPQKEGDKAQPDDAPKPSPEDPGAKRPGWRMKDGRWQKVNPQSD